jgi:hypothetical protein
LKVRKDLQEKGLKLLIGAIDFVDEKDDVLVCDLALNGLQEGSGDEKLPAENILNTFERLFAGFSHFDAKQLLGIIPFIQRGCYIQTLVALEPDESSAEGLGHHLGHLCLADPRFPF